MMEMEVRHRCAQLSDMGIRLRGLTSLCAQKWEGDINITLPVTFSQVKILNPKYYTETIFMTVMCKLNPLVTQDLTHNLTSLTYMIGTRII